MIDLYNAGRQYRQSGDLPRAEAAFRELLSFEPTNAEVWQALGSVCREQGKHDDALNAFQRAVALDPEFAQAHNSLGIVFFDRGMLPQAAECFEKAVSHNPDLAAAHNNLGNVYLALGRKDEALTHYQDAVRIVANFAEAHGNLGNVLRELGRTQEALASCLRAVDLKPAFAIGHNHLGAVYAGQRRWEEAAASFRQAILHEPKYPEAQANLGDMLRQIGRLAEAEAALREAVRLRPTMAQAHLSLALVLLDRDRLQPAAASCREALRHDPRMASAWQALGMIDVLEGRNEEAIDSYRQAIAIDPRDAASHRNLAIVELLLGNYEQGWSEYEWRWQSPEAGERTFARPLWDGSPLAGKTILLHAEQGLGDTIQFARYATVARQRGGRVILACQRALMPLMRGTIGVDEVTALGGPVPDFDVHAPLMSLPYLLGATVSSIPAPVPYVDADPQLLEKWRGELTSIPGFKVGIAWQGSPAFKFDRYRSIALEDFAPLAALPGVTLVSLQKGFGSEQIAELTGQFNVVDLTGRFDEGGAFLDTAAIMKNLDLVITSDSAAPHLAGALGVPVWLATPFAPDWRWLTEREDSPWYPTMRLFRQERRGEWRTVFQRMAAALADKLGAALPASALAVEVAPGELLDKISILEIKSERIADEAKLRNVRTELDTLREVQDRHLPRSTALDAVFTELKRVNEALWEIEDEIREEERKEEFGARFIELARSVYRQNDRRAALKRRINDLLGSRLIEEKSYRSYGNESL